VVVYVGYGDDSRPCPIPHPIPGSARLAELITLGVSRDSAWRRLVLNSSGGGLEVSSIACGFWRYSPRSGVILAGVAAFRGKWQSKKTGSCRNNAIRCYTTLIKRSLNSLLPKVSASCGRVWTRMYNEPHMKWIANLLGFGALYSWFAYFDPRPGESVGPSRSWSASFSYYWQTLRRQARRSR
jgi:hypothetical protein